MSDTHLPEWLSVVPGIGALLGSFFGIGAAMQRIKHLELEIGEIKKKTDTIGEIKATIDGLVDRAEVTDGKLDRLNDKVDRLIEAMLEDARQTLAERNRERRGARKPTP